MDAVRLAALRGARRRVAEPPPPSLPVNLFRVDALLSAPRPGLTKGVDYQLSSAPPRPVACGCALAVDACGGLADAADVARHAALLSDFYENTEPFTVVLALVRKPKVIAYGRPMRMRDINGGVTLHDERLIVVWRLDPDFYKVLTHELVHLLSPSPVGDSEAATEATALRLWCALRAARGEGGFGLLLRRQAAHTAALACAVARADGGETNAWAYTAGALAVLAGREGGAPPPPPPPPPGSAAHVQAGTEFEFTWTCV